MIKYIPNIITFSRILGTIVMIFVPALSKKFFIAYTYSGISDVLDGFVARKTNTTSEFGSKLDGFSDLFFYTVMMIKLMPELIKKLPRKIWLIINITLIIRLCLYLYFFIFKHRFISNHTIFNKLTGLMVFFIPYVINSNKFITYALCVSVVAFVAAIYEIIVIKKG